VYKFKNKKIMIVDDDEEFLGELRDMFVSSGYEVNAISDPALALEAVHKISPDVILLDLKMQKMSGFQVADKLRNFSEVNRIPIIAMTAFFVEEEHSLLMKLCGIKNCLKKPFSPTEAIERIEAAL
jgi:DNA-binding response OmpR family regulator